MYAPLDAQQKKKKLEIYKKQMANMNAKETNLFIEKVTTVLAFDENHKEDELPEIDMELVKTKIRAIGSKRFQRTMPTGVTQ
jgi:hypothetical protein